MAKTSDIKDWLIIGAIGIGAFLVYQFTTAAPRNVQEWEEKAGMPIWCASLPFGILFPQ